MKRKNDSPVKITHVFVYMLFFSLQLMYVFPIRGGIFSVVSTFYTYATMLVTIYSVMFVLAFRKVNYVLISWLLLFLAIALSIYLNGNTSKDGFYTLIRNFYRSIGIAFFIQIHKKNLKSELKAIFAASFILITLNAVTMILFPNCIFGGGNMPPVWLIGQKQDFVNVFLFAYVLNFIFWKEKRMKKYILLTNIIMWLSMLWSFPLGLMLSLFGISFMMYLAHSRFIYWNGKFLYAMNLTGQFIATVFAQIYTTSFSLYTTLKGVTSLRGEGLNKADSILQRVHMWQDVLDILSKSPLFGGGRISYMHNQIFDLGFSGGLIAISIFILLNIYVFRKFDRYKGRNRDILVIAIFAANVLNLTECRSYSAYIFILYILAFHIKELNRVFE